MSLVTVAPALFVLIWSTGWIVAKYAAAYADPLYFLVVRFACAFVLMAAIALAFRAPWPRNRAAYGHGMLSGVLLHAIYLGGVWWAVARGLPVGVSALIAAIQPLMTAALSARLAGERIGRCRSPALPSAFSG